jgi:hypothetical protein
MSRSMSVPPHRWLSGVAARRKETMKRYAPKGASEPRWIAWAGDAVVVARRTASRRPAGAIAIRRSLASCRAVMATVRAMIEGYRRG